MRKKICAVIALFALLLQGAMVSAADEYALKEIIFQIGNPYLTVNEEQRQIDPENPNVVPFIEEESGRAMVPLRAFVDTFGYKMETVWDETKPDEVVVRFERGDGLVGPLFIVWNDSAEATFYDPIKSTTSHNSTLHETRQYTMEVPACTVEGRTFVPARFLADVLGLHIGWDAELRRVTFREKKDEELFEDHILVNVDGDSAEIISRSVNLSGRPILTRRGNFNPTIQIKDEHGKVYYPGSNDYVSAPTVINFGVLEADHDNIASIKTLTDLPKQKYTVTSPSRFVGYAYGYRPVSTQDITVTFEIE